MPRISQLFFKTAVVFLVGGIGRGRQLSMWGVGRGGGAWV